jgi:hypothetical protein
MFNIQQFTFFSHSTIIIIIINAHCINQLSEWLHSVVGIRQSVRDATCDQSSPYSYKHVDTFIERNPRDKR